MKIADVRKYKNGHCRVDFYPSDLYEIVKNDLDFRFTTVGGTGGFIRLENGRYRRTDFQEMQQALLDYIETEFDKLVVSNEIAFTTFMDAFYEKLPIKNGPHIREFLSEVELSEANALALKRKSVIQYRYENQKKKRLES